MNDTICPLTQKPCSEHCEWRMQHAPYSCSIPQIAVALKEIAKNTGRIK